jgi:hypothetical protein
MPTRDHLQLAFVHRRAPRLGSRNVTFTVRATRLCRWPCREVGAGVCRAERAGPCQKEKRDAICGPDWCFSCRALLLILDGYD